jgi:DNA-directed RNA polymerase specialized sigma24 family protein
MGSRNRYHGIDPTLIQSVQAHARRLSRTNALPGKEIEDIEQELMLHVLRRSGTFDPKRASFPTFIDRIVRSRAAALSEAARTQKRGFGTEIVLFTDLDTNSETETEPPTDRIGAHQALWGSSGHAPEDVAMLRSDLSRLFGTLPDGLRQCCRWLLEDSVGDVCQRTGLARGSIHSRIETLRRRCRQVGLDNYFGASPAFLRSSR